MKRILIALAGLAALFLAAGANAVLIPAKLEAGMVYTTSIAAQRDFGFNGFLAKMVLRY